MADPDSRAGERYADPAIRHFTDQLHAPHDEALAAAFAAPAASAMPEIMLGAAEGRLLELLVRMVAATRVVEIGTLAGYSALRIARGLAPGGRLWTIEADPRHAAVARRMLADGAYAGQVEVIEGRALDCLPGLERHAPFDLVFLDADKERYDAYAEWALRHLRRGGLLVGDNAYFFGDLLDPGAAAAAMRRFHQLVAAACESVCVPTPDGMVVGIKR
jgi:caffeoyl-CoA O-methyltransferase